MSDKIIDDGGPAFPVKVNQPYKKGRWEYGLPGMTLRDWFAGQSLSAVIQRYEVLTGTDELPAPVIPSAVAEMAYRYADAMLAARKEGK